VLRVGVPRASRHLTWHEPAIARREHCLGTHGG
jgi:hypothetical protein